MTMPVWVFGALAALSLISVLTAKNGESATISLIFLLVFGLITFHIGEQDYDQYRYCTHEVLHADTVPYVAKNPECRPFILDGLNPTGDTDDPE